MGITQLDGRNRCFPAAAKPCDCCESAAALLFCRAESAFMCMACDAKLHNAADDKLLSAALKHERVWMCEVCEQAPAAVTCKADAATLCLTCDRDIHSANPLARRHDRAAVVPFYDTAATLLGGDSDRKQLETSTTLNDYIPDSWIFTEPFSTSKLLAANQDTKSIDFFFSDSDQFLDFDSIVPVQTTVKVKPPVQAQTIGKYSRENRFEIDFTRSNITSYTNSHSVSPSSTSTDAGIVPDVISGAISETTPFYPFATTVKLNNYDVSSVNQGSEAVGMDRKARVLRYKEKKKNRKFEKTIRYASRKAYAETRPRIKGRFAKRTEYDSDMDEVFGSGAGNFFADAGYGVVPSF